MTRVFLFAAWCVIGLGAALFSVSPLQADGFSLRKGGFDKEGSGLSSSDLAGSGVVVHGKRGVLRPSFQSGKTMSQPEEDENLLPLTADVDLSQPLKYYVIDQTLQTVLQELCILTKLNATFETPFDQRLQNQWLQGTLPEILATLGREHGFVWSIENDAIEIASVKSVLSRSIKADGFSEERIFELLTAAGLKDIGRFATYDPTTKVLRLRGTPRLVAKAEAAILIARGPEDDTINVVRYGRSSQTNQPAPAATP